MVPQAWQVRARVVAKSADAMAALMRVVMESLLRRGELTVYWVATVMVPAAVVAAGVTAAVTADAVTVDAVTADADAVAVTADAVAAADADRGAVVAAPVPVAVVAVVAVPVAEPIAVALPAPLSTPSNRRDTLTNDNTTTSFAPTNPLPPTFIDPNTPIWMPTASPPVSDKSVPSLTPPRLIEIFTTVGGGGKHDILTRPGAVG
jgi:hypothetical protein